MYIHVCMCVFTAAQVPPLPKQSEVHHAKEMSRMVQLDMHYGKECAKVIHYYKFITEEINRVYKLMHQAALCFG